MNEILYYYLLMASHETILLILAQELLEIKEETTNQVSSFSCNKVKFLCMYYRNRINKINYYRLLKETSL